MKPINAIIAPSLQ